VTPEHIFQSSIESLVHQIQNKTLSARTVMEAVYQRIEAHNELLNVYRSLLPKAEALKRADAVDARIKAGEQTGKFAGIPVSIKDNICITDPGLGTGCGSKILEGYHSPYNARVVESLLNHDALIIGTTNMDEFAMGSSTENSAYGPTRNPWDTERVPGGSSGGAAVSIASQMALLALGSDTGGSVRQPASLSGVTGFKPTYGSVSRYGLVAFGSSFDQIGPMTRSAEDAAYAFSILHGHDAHDNTSLKSPLPAHSKDVDLSNLKFCMPEEYCSSDAVSPSVIASIQTMENFLKDQGATVAHRSLPFLENTVPTYCIIAFAEASSNLGRFDGIRYGHRTETPESLKILYAQSREEGFGPEVKRRIMLGTFALSSGYYDEYYGRAFKIRKQLERQVDTILEEFDFIMGPVSPFPAFRLGEKSKNPLAMYLADTCSVLANLVQNPAISIPAPLSEEGLPIGFQLLGKKRDDFHLLATCNAIQKQTDHHLKLPALLGNQA